MSPSQVEHFRDHGYLRLEAFHPKKRIAAVRQALLDELQRLKAPSGGKSLPAALRKLPVFQQIGRLSALVEAPPGMQEALMTPALSDAVAHLCGQAPPAAAQAQLLLSPPSQGAWTLERLNWHVDLAARPQDLVPGVQVFFLIDDVAPHGGATLALAGSHRAGLPGQPSAAALREALKAQADPSQALQALHAPGIRIVEMCGRAGDVFLMDPRLLHTPSVNATKNVRMMATARCFLRA